jgi:hypothetical protein
MQGKRWLFILLLFAASATVGFVQTAPATWTSAAAWTETLWVMLAFCVIEPVIIFFSLFMAQGGAELRASASSRIRDPKGMSWYHPSYGPWLYCHDRKKWTKMALICLLPFVQIPTLGVAFFAVALFVGEIPASFFAGYFFGLAFTILLAHEYYNRCSD